MSHTHPWRALALAAAVLAQTGFPESPAPLAQDDPASLVRAYWTEATLMRESPSRGASRPVRTIVLHACASGSTAACLRGFDSGPGRSLSSRSLGRPSSDARRSEGYRRDRAWPSCTPCIRPANPRTGGPGRCSAYWGRAPATSSSRRLSTGRTTSPPSRRLSPSTPPFSMRSPGSCTSTRTRVCLRLLEGRVCGLVRHAVLRRPIRGDGGAGGGIRRRARPDGFWKHIAPNVAHVPC